MACDRLCSIAASAASTPNGFISLTTSAPTAASTRKLPKEMQREFGPLANDEVDRLGREVTAAELRGIFAREYLDRAEPWKLIHFHADGVDGVFVCTRKERLLARTGSPYLALELRDRGGAVAARMFRDADLHGGRVQIHSKIGEGTTVTVRIPVFERDHEKDISH